jgi:hypothetical protein
LGSGTVIFVVVRCSHSHAVPQPLPCADDGASEAASEAAHHVMGCVAWVRVESRVDVAFSWMRFMTESDSELSCGCCACLIAAMDGARPEEIDLDRWIQRRPAALWIVARYCRQ